MILRCGFCVNSKVKARVFARALDLREQVLLLLALSLFVVRAAAIRSLLGLGSRTRHLFGTLLSLGGRESAARRLLERGFQLGPANLTLEFEGRRQNIRRTELDQARPDTATQLAVGVQFRHCFHDLFPEIVVLPCLVERRVQDLVLHAAPVLLEFPRDQHPGTGLKEAVLHAGAEVVHGDPFEDPLHDEIPSGLVPFFGQSDGSFDGAMGLTIDAPNAPLLVTRRPSAVALVAVLRGIGGRGFHALSAHWTLPKTIIASLANLTK